MEERINEYTEQMIKLIDGYAVNIDHIISLLKVAVEKIKELDERITKLENNESV